MHFGRVENLKALNPVLPADSVRTEKFLNLPRESATTIYVGCPIWSSKEWVGELYARGTKPGQFLSKYSQIFNCVELNSSFYHMPNPHQVSQWRDETPETFRFCPKVFRGITENLAAPHMPTLVNQFCEAVLHFGIRRGLTFAQFPESFSPRQFPLLEKFLDAWPQEIPLSVELRHPEWFHHHALPDPIVNLFYRRKVASLITDTAGRRDVLHFSLTQPKILIRFQGNENPAIDQPRINEWAKRIGKWQEHRLEEIYFFIHQPGDSLIPKTAQFAAYAIENRDIVFPAMADQMLLL